VDNLSKDRGSLSLLAAELARGESQRSVAVQQIRRGDDNSRGKMQNVCADSWVAGAPTKVEGRYVVQPSGVFGRSYDIAANGQRFLMTKAAGSDATGAPPQIVVVQHFDEELKRLVPTK